MRRNPPLSSLRLTPLPLPWGRQEYIPPEDDAKRFPFAAATAEHLNRWENTNFQHYQRVRFYLGLRSSSSQRNQSIWKFRWEWAFPDLPTAKEFMEEVYGESA